ncbi:MAG: 23S rRNA (uracil(1939)-C(5))-methyltransferase RlmD [Pseudomonadota bacterium]|nr:23S rRNA (uracil(1939)-C(5))-methyltransferase RlmD [Pseudomonadota bacterium]
MGRRRTRSAPAAPIELAVDALAHDGRGIGRVEGKTAFIHNALPGERVRYQRWRKRRDYDEGDALEVLQPSPDRVTPPCAHFGVCGGCALQHLAPAAQREAKAAGLLENLQRIGGVQPARVLPPLAGPALGYRRKARLAVKDVPAKGRVLVGFRERRAPYVADCQRCEVLHPQVGALLLPLSALIGGLGIRTQLPQIEVAVADNATALVLRVLAPPSASDRAQLAAFAETHGLQIFLQHGGPESLEPLTGPPPPLAYELPDFDLEMHFTPTQFTQINHEINRQMVQQAIDLLAPAPDWRVLDLFCGIGNFTLPLARHAGRVHGIEGAAELVSQAEYNGRRHGIDNVSFSVADLYTPPAGGAAPADLPAWARTGVDGVLLDPPRSGAEAILPWLARTGPRRIVYVSCHPATLARDAGRLVGEHGYRLAAAGIMDMFPHTAHVESMALFERD